MLDYIEAHKFSRNHMVQLNQDSICGCFYCGRVFNPAEITQWLIDENACNSEGTALCPYCGIDSIIGGNSGFPITKEFLGKMKQYWFA